MAIMMIARNAIEFFIDFSDLGYDYNTSNDSLKIKRLEGIFVKVSMIEEGRILRDELWNFIDNFLQFISKPHIIFQ